MNWAGFFMLLAYLFVSSMIIRMLASFTEEKKMGVVTMEAMYLVVGAFLPLFIISLIIDGLLKQNKTD